MDVSNIDTSVSLFGVTHKSPILLCPVGLQQMFHPEAEVVSARAAAARAHGTKLVDMINSGELPMANYEGLGDFQDESDRSTIECLPEVAAAVDGAMPVLIDGGFRRGTDVFKALALGADAVCIGRPYIWGLAGFGQPGVEHALDLLDAELVRIMRLAGVTTIADIDGAFVKV